VTIVVGVATPEGLVIAADSRSTLLNGQHHRVASDNTMKVFSVCSRLAVATYGDAFIGDTSIARLIEDFEAQLSSPADITAKELADQLATFFGTAFKAAGKITAPGEVAVGFLVAGYDSDGLGRIYDVLIPQANSSELFNTATRGWIPRGVSEAAYRLVAGLDWELAERTGISVEQSMVTKLESLRYKVLYPATQQDAVDFATFLVRTTIDMQRFSDGTLAEPIGIPACGGPIRVISVTRSGTEWVANPPLALSQSGVAEEG
jgi:hypothetical protein